MTADLLARARSGDQSAFGLLIDPYRRELQVHCYRMLGSLHDAEDVVQETLMAAWRALPEFAERASLRTWLYRIATNRCLNALREARRRPHTSTSGLDLDRPEPTRLVPVQRLEPLPDTFLDELADSHPGPGTRYETREAVSLAFMTALDLLPERQRAVLVLRDVLGFSVRETAHILDTTEQAVAGALKRARATMTRHHHTTNRPKPALPGSAAEKQLLTRLTRALENGDVDGIVALLTDDAWLRMPPMPFEYQGHDRISRFLTTVAFREHRRYRVAATRANGQPALAIYLTDSHTGTAHLNGLWVVTLAEDRISDITRFDHIVLAPLQLPPTLTAWGASTNHAPLHR